MGTRPLGFFRRAANASADAPQPAPAWVASLDEDDLHFLKRFLLSSGSLKAMADEFDISYPTVRGRLDRLIAKVQAAEDPKITDPFHRRLKVLVADGDIPSALARELLELHRSTMRNPAASDDDKRGGSR
jgi:hypothetical protein